ncbi:MULTISPECIES: Lrp/AsnC family transcriptional regulator [Pseudomonas]|uniref:siroheme decarboxylase subunit beta n=1 Tax=Pseudomonas TaxID=286 RepID=UPI0008763967|nr:MULTISPECIES: Lrp/AsnC family transcriptional regulator [Pseudomonas]MDB6446344.1 Lrp/AsnC family transcriptional regulator [Pseudomonas sp. 21TX0197]MDT8905830.1 Lrp/AsnC family transcriptional regulator [Pseudomonas prosekii]NHN67972.1 Lrp/AsnC family transcriptional regulator [Pseudomonas fluorescens]ROO34587.1 protein nirL [Pseudomonas sp. AF76]ROO34742.1 protein nirL [Pseudomonas sp. 7SR1]
MNNALSERQSLALRRLLETGLPLTPRPFQALAGQIEAREEQVLEQMRQWHQEGLFRRVGLVVNHRALGFAANAMLVLDVPDALVDEVGRRLGQAPGISLCYQRPRRLPQWQYNLFCMIHGRQRDRVQAQVKALLEQHLLDDLPHELLFSSHLFKQCGGRYAPPAGARLDG